MTRVSVSDALDAKVSSSDPSGSLKSVGTGVAAVALGFTILMFGLVAGGRLTGLVDSVLGTSAGGGGIPVNRVSR